MAFSTFRAHTPFARTAWGSSLALASLLGLTVCQPPAADEGTGDGDGDADGSTGMPGDGDGDDSPAIICEPGETQCADETTLEICAPTGLTWEPMPCDGYQTCVPCFGENADDCVAACVGPCELVSDQASSEGCSFFATSMYQAGQTTMEDPPDAIVVGNPNLDRPAQVTLSFAPEGSNIEEVVEGPIEVMPGDSHVFLLPAELTQYMQNTSLYRSGAVHHVTSDLPIVAYLHAPYEGTSTNGSTLLLPEHIMTGDYVVFGSPAYTKPSYFSIIALEDQTTVRWRPTVETAGDQLPLPFVEAGEQGEQLLNRLDNIRIDTSSKYERPNCEQDLAGTVIEADKPIWVVSAVRGARIPFCHPQMAIDGCDTIIDNCWSGSDFLLEQNLPLDYWGREYVGPHAPLRGTEDHYWRIYAGEADIDVTVDPPQPGTPIHLDARGDWEELIVPNGTHLTFSATGPIMPVQYLAGHWVANNIGSPAMIQMVPIAQFLDNYVFVTGYNYELNYVQVIRPAGGAGVTLDDNIPIDTWEQVGDWDIATVLIPEGPHAIESADFFGIIQYGYTVLPDPNNPTNDPSSAYGYPGGMKAEVIYVP